MFESHAAKVNYAEVRTRVAHAFAEKAHEVAEAIDVLQSLSKESIGLLDKAKAQCEHYFDAIIRRLLCLALLNRCLATIVRQRFADLTTLHMHMLLY